MLRLPRYRDGRWYDCMCIVTFYFWWRNYGEIVVWCYRARIFRCSTIQSYQKLSTKGRSVLVPFALGCESGLSSLLDLKNKDRKRLNPTNDLRVALSTCVPWYERTVSEKQHQKVITFASNDQ